ncbi:DNA polymerase IV [Nocardia farcinica]|uniref:DNA polymerase IV n=1 Tax=Nocardia farcinica TaxID=37329 RepID=UPI00189517C7|nr:DNA polymerase IV [Nocardia farcinica]MBF6255999.1 DNA polymerase IV [Nocardia farcinica]MBF6260902.1 DNA polymerase IV [Nocardia farcinica]MBF6279430.1 DNA polymerase IV [Nocardia farcinica]MBF6303912.1 DNA polymerase IV [Nocardia farcinica]MBF6310133.1 DNA polymerase IV [Nocardia farcinica]
MGDAGAEPTRAPRPRIEARADASILHADLDSFYASVEQRDDPSLRGRPVIVGGGVVLAASYEAKAFGVRTPMNGARALRLCPQAVVVPPRMSAYAAASKAVFEVFRDTTPVVEGISIDEAFLYVAGLRRIAGEPIEIARRLRARVRDEVGLPISVGIARTKFLAKVASAVAKPDGLRLVEPERELEFLHPLPVERLWGVGDVTARTLHEHGITRIAQLAELGESGLRGFLGPAAARHLSALAMARDPRRVETGRRRRSLGAQRALGRRHRAPEEVAAYLHGLVDRLGRRLRAADRLCRTVVLRMRFDDFTRATRSHTLPEPTDDTATVLRAARLLLDAATPMIQQRGLTLIGLSLTNLVDADPLQLTLPLEPRPTGTLDRTLDELRRRFGSAAVTRAALITSGEGLSVPLLPD